jgi:hypothetical protein
LSFGTLVSLQEGKLGLRFDALGNHSLLEILARINDGAHDGRVIGIGGDLVYEGPVNLQDINRKLTKIAQAGIPGSEIIYGNMYAMRLTA